MSPGPPQGAIVAGGATPEAQPIQAKWADSRCGSYRPCHGHESGGERVLRAYASALLARDAKAIAGMYAVPSLILFPGRSIAVSDARQTERFFGSSWSQYEGVDVLDKEIVVMAEAPSSIWVDVTWIYGGQPRERFCYQLIERGGEHQIAVLTPMR